MKNFINSIHLFIASALFLTSCSQETAPEAKNEEHHEEETTIVSLTEAQFKIAEIELGNLTMRTISGTISASGLLDVPPQSKVSISAPMGGFVKSTELLQGSRVEKGQIVAVMQHADYIQVQQDYLEETSQLEFLKAEYERQDILSKENINAQKSAQQAKANFLTTQAHVAGLKAKLQLLQINTTNLEKGIIQNTINLYAPISGYVTKVNTNIGAFVNPTDVLLEIVNTEHLHVELTIFEKDVPKLKIGQRVFFTLANENKQRIAKIELIGREIGPDRSVQVHCHIDEEDREMLPGMYLKASIETTNTSVAAIPNEAIINFQGKNYLFIETSEEVTAHESEEHEAHEGGEHEGHHEEEGDFQYQMIEVEVGQSEGGFSEILPLKGIDLSTKIVTGGAYHLMAKMKNSESEGHVH